MEGYELLHVIGSGSFGKVFMGRNKVTGETVALKKISKGGRQEREIRSLRQECEIQKNLHHPNIIQMLDSFETDDSVVVVTEYAQGDLCKLMIREGRLPNKKVQLIACHLVSALYFLHSHRILHRDIKPQNILIGWDGKAKLCDFGFARTMGINTYMLTSIKGTPLYMAPEIVQEKPYDHNADLWSLGCILYELLMGTPPFFTTSLFQLVRKIKNEEIVWPERIPEECLSFLKGLLDKNPQTRLTWPILLGHPLVRDGLYIDKRVEEFALTKALSPSQEVAKEKQRQNLQRKLAGYSKLLVKTAKKLEEAQKELKRCSEDGRAGIKTPQQSPSTAQAPPAKSSRGCSNIGVPPQDPLKISPNLHSALPEQKNLKVMFQNMNLNERARHGMQATQKQDEDDQSGGSSCETMTSSSEFETDESDEGDDDANTVILEGNRKRHGKKNAGSNVKHGSAEDQVNRLGFLDISRGDKSSSRGGTDLLWKSGALFTLHSFGSEDKPINSDEWISFLMNTMKEVLDNPKSLCEKHFLTMLVAPLRNHLADPEVVEKIAVLLSLPFTLDKSILEQEPELMSNLQTLYLDTKVLPNLLYSCKLIVRRRRVERGSVALEELPTILTVEDLEGLHKCLRLMTFLVHTDEDFVNQLCDSVCVLHAFAILQLFIKLDGVRSGLASDTISILSHILRTIPSNKAIVEEVLLDENDSDSPEPHAELWRLISHSNPTIQSRSLRAFAYLCLNSERVKTEFLDKHRSKVWKILRRASISSQADLRATALFVIQALNRPGSSATTKSNSTPSNSGCQGQMIGTNSKSSTSTPCDPISSNQIQDESSEQENAGADSATSEELQVEESEPLPPVTHRSGPLGDASR